MKAIMYRTLATLDDRGGVDAKPLPVICGFCEDPVESILGNGSWQEMNQNYVHVKDNTPICEEV